ncbi:LacI family DNA-binding transcriptional regulator [Paenibacillus sp. MBLB4367]|uniref:LacI family DNA-binding transcriptional regulator n=1 Tax=Paenibacillus sp. MBLB4367 TaxID=3384767 RepID=UPI00390831E1
MRVTRELVAKVAGVSTATVSYVLNNSRSVSEEARRKVLEAVKELKYTPDMIARSMVTNETKQLGIVLNEIINPFYGEIILGFENAAIEKGYFVNICTGYKNLDDYFDNFIARRVDGVFVVAIPYKFHMEKIYNLVDAGIKVVMSGNAEADIKKLSSIENDYVDAMHKAVEYLTGLGHRHIAYVSGLGKSQKFDRKIEGYLSAVHKWKLPCEDSLLIDGSAPYGTTIEDGYRLANRLIASGKPFTAVVCTNDMMALGAMNALKHAGLNVPEDVSVMGFDGIQIGGYWDPSLTTMAVPTVSLGERAFELLYTNLKKDNTGYFLNKLELIERNSTGACKS